MKEHQGTLEGESVLAEDKDGCTGLMRRPGGGHLVTEKWRETGSGEREPVEGRGASRHC